MATAWSEIVSENAMLVIDDEGLNQMAVDNPALFFRKMALYVNMALPLLCKPYELQDYLQNGMTAPTFASDEWVSTQASTTQATNISTGIAGYELFSCQQVSVDGCGNTVFTPYLEAVYNAATGVVTMPKQESVGVEYTFDFYKDGSFSDLTITQKRLFGIAIASVWDERFFRNALNDTPKIKDKSFNTVNESEYMRASIQKKNANRAALFDELRRYEQDCYKASAMYGTKTLV